MTAADLIKTIEGKTAIGEYETKALLAALGLPVPRGSYVAGEEELPRPLALSYPLVAKVVSPRIAAKSEVRGVRLGIADEEALRQTVDELKRIEGAEGVLIEEMAPQGVEVIAGGIIDPQFGPVVMFGLGGVFVELYKDVVFGLAPLGEEEALRLAARIKGYRLLQGYRGAPPVDMNALARVLTAVSEIIATGRIEEITLNPVALYPDSAMVLDAKMVVRQI